MSADNSPLSPLLIAPDIVSPSKGDFAPCLSQPVAAYHSFRQRGDSLLGAVTQSLNVKVSESSHSRHRPAGKAGPGDPIFLPHNKLGHPDALSARRVMTIVVFCRDRGCFRAG